MRVPLLFILMAGCSDGGGGTSSCSKSVDSYCSQAGATLCSWSDYQDRTQYPCDRTTMATCGGYYVAFESGVDTSTTRYYDMTSGKLVAIIGSFVPRGQTCSVGPSGGFSAPMCDRLQTVASCDGGVHD